MRITIIVPDEAVYQDMVSFTISDLSSCNIPEHVRVLQFNTDKNAGWLEYYLDDFGVLEPNTPITELPEWAVAAMAKWVEAEEKTREIPTFIPAGVVTSTDTPTTTTTSTDTPTTTTTSSDGQT